MGVHGDKTVVGGKTSTLNSLSPTNTKKKTPTEISSNLKSNSKKASSSPAAGSGQRANASASVDANMAPALTEPISPTEKLSAASVSPTTATISTESEECKSETTITTAAATTSSPAIASSSRASPANRERRATTRNTVAPSTRVTRSKDNAAQERANTPSTAVRDSPTATVTSLRKSKRNSKEQDNEQMGLSAATPSAAATTTTSNSPTPTTAAVSTPADTSASTSNNNNNNIACKDNSTAQLLADLTTDFEETITAEICLRKQLPEVKVTTPDAAQLSASSETESETTASKSAAGGGETPEIGSSTKPMETVADNDASGSGVCKNDNLQTNAEEPPKLEKQIEEAKVQNVNEPAENTNLPVEHSSTAESAPVLDLPPVNSDSTMTASEEEPEELDALEAKLSQLDGTAVENTISAFVNDTANVTLTPATFASTVVTVTTPPQSQPQQHAMVQPQQPQQQQQMLPQTATASGSTPTQQLLLTPTGSSTSSQHMLALTPQSTSSLLREMTAAGVPGGGGELEDQELEEVLKALKGFDANAAGAEGVLCDLNVLLNEVYTTFNCDEIAATNSGAAGGSVVSGAIQQQQQPQTNLLASTSAAAITKLSTTSPLKELHVDIEKKQHIMQRKIDIILRRLRKLQVRYMSKHTTEEIAGLFELAARITHKGSNSDGVNSTKDMLAASVISARPPPRSWEEDLKTAISSTEMLNLLERLEKSANSQQICTATTSNSSSSPTYASPTISTTQQMRKNKKFSELTSNSAATTTSSSSTAAGATSSSCTTITATADGDAQRSDDCVIPILNPQVVDELTHVTGMLRAEMRDIQVAYDSDATESSSGGESADEMVAYNNQVQQSLSIVKRAAWRYSRERAAIASRWSWLLSQIADLEIKIRQHSELFQEVVRTKGAVVCEEELARASTTSREQPLINAYGENEEIILSGACRTRGFLASQFRKRKMLQTTSLHTISKKAARPSTIKCGCQCPLNPCALCTGRTDPTAPRDLPDTMMFPERVALLDPGFHPVLSFSDNVSNSIHFEAIARTPHWQNRIVRIQPKSVVRSVWKAEREAANLNSHHSSRKYGDILMPTQKRRYIRRKERNVVGNKAASTTSADLDATTPTDFAIPAAAAPASTPPIHKTTAISKFETSTPTPTAAAGATTSTLAAAGNGTATLFGSTTPTTTTPLVANKMTSKNVPPSKKMHCLLVGDGVLLEPLSPNNTNNNNSPANSCQTPQNYDPFNPSQTPSSLISNSQQQHNNNNSSSNTSKKRHYKRKSVVSLQQQFSSSSSSINNNSHINHTQHTQLPQTQAHSYNHNNNTQSNNSNGDINFDYWDTAGGGRSRTASPTHGIIGGSSSNYHKYERSLERRNRISYDIDNIVIPYSVAAATRVEILPYKEIPTPKWRVFDDELAFDQEQEDEISTEHLETKVNDKQQSEITLNEQQQQQQNEATTKTTTTINNLQENKNIITSDNKTVVDVDEDDDKKFAKPAEAIKLFKDLQKHTNEKNETKELLTSTKAQICDKKTKANCVNNKTTTTVMAHVATNNIDESEHLPPPAKKMKADAINAHVNENANDTAFSSSSSGDVCSTETQETITAADLNEDITDEAFDLRHERALHEERRKFQTFLKFPWSTRSRANRRIDSRAESSGANTPDPASPAPNTPSLGGGDQESIPSPLAPSTPLTPLDAVNEAPESGSVTIASSTHSSAAATASPAFPLNVAAILSNYSNSGISKRNERRRTTSTKTQHSTERNERRSLTPDSREVPSFAIPPFEPLKFPLSQESYDTLASVTYLPPSVSSFYADGDLSKQQHEFEQQQHNSSNSVGGNILGVGGGFGGSHFKTVTPRNGRRTTSTSKVVNCDFSGRKRRPYRRQQSIRDAEHKVADSNDDDITMKTATATTTTSLINGKIAGGIGVTAHSTDVDDYDDEDDDYEDYYDELAEEDDDDGYPKHPLAPGMDIDKLVDDENDNYDPYGISGIGGGVGGGNKLGNHSNHHLGLSDSEFSEPDPFEDDDPNDPEWKGESSTKAERHSERLRKRSYF